MPHTTEHPTKEEQREANTARQRRYRAMETDEKRQKRHQKDTDAHHPASCQDSTAQFCSRLL